MREDTAAASTGASDALCAFSTPFPHLPPPRPRPPGRGASAPAAPGTQPPPIPMGVWAAVAITTLSAGGSAIGKAWQKEATRGLPRLSAASWREYAAHPRWAAGVGLDVAGALLLVAAYAQAPVRG